MKGLLLSGKPRTLRSIGMFLYSSPNCFIALLGTWSHSATSLMLGIRGLSCLFQRKKASRLDYDQLFFLIHLVPSLPLSSSPLPSHSRQRIECCSSSASSWRLRPRGPSLSLLPIDSRPRRPEEVPLSGSRNIYRHPSIFSWSNPIFLAL